MMGSRAAGPARAGSSLRWRPIVPTAIRQLLGIAAIDAAMPAHASDTAEIMRRIRDPQAGLIVIAHRGCHDPAPRHGLSTAPENSALADLTLAQSKALRLR